MTSTAPSPRRAGQQDAMAGTLRAFASYAWATAEDKESLTRLVDELRLRGFVTFRDSQAMPPGGDIEGVIRDELARSTVFVPYMTPAALKSDPVVDLEFRTAAELARAQGSPVVLPVVQNLGTDRQQLTSSTWGRLQHDFSAQWTQLPEAGDDPLEISDAAAHAREALRASFPEGAGPASGSWDLTLATRGARPAPAQLTIDATDLIGGPTARPGTPEDWARFLHAVGDLQHVLTAHGHRRELRVQPSCHLGAALAIGWMFRRATGWRITVGQHDQECTASEARHHPDLQMTRQNGAFRRHGGQLVVIVDLVPRGIASDVVRSLVQPPRAVLTISVAPGSPRIPVAELGAMAGAVAEEIKALRGQTGADEVALYLATPAAFSVHLGADLGALGCPVQLSEYDAGRYHPSILIPG